jgi:hypothetical protein
MKRLLLAALLFALPLLAQDKISLENRVSPKPGGAAGDIPYAASTTVIGWIAHATGLQCLTQNGAAAPTWGSCGGGATSPLTTKGDIWGFSTTGGISSDARIPIGTDTYVLTVDSTQTLGLKWAAPSVGTVTSITATAPLTGGAITGSGSIGCATMGASGSGTHAPGCTPDTSTSAGTTKYLREDATWQTPSGGGVGTTLTTLKETVFAGITPASYANGTTTTVDGSGYTATVAGNGAIDIVATGLRLRQGTTSSTNTQIFQISAGNTGDFNSIVGEERMRRGAPWAFWIRIASYDYTNTASATTVYGIIDVWTGRYGARIGRMRNVLGAPNSTTGGLAYDYWWNSGVGLLGSYSSIGVSSADVLCIVFRTPLLLEAYVGTYSGGWPALGSMTKAGSMMPATSTAFMMNANSDMGSTNMAIRFLLGTSAATTGTYEIIFDRFRITTW